MTVETSQTRSESGGTRSTDQKDNNNSTDKRNVTVTDTELTRNSESVTVISGDTVLSPVEAKAQLIQMNVKHQNGELFTVQTPTGDYDVNTETTDCTCLSSLPDREKPCEHIQRVYNLAEQNTLGTTISAIGQRTSDLISPSEKNKSRSNTETTTQNKKTTGRSISCEECGENIGHTTQSKALIEYQTCNVCALDSPNLYHLSQSDSTDDDELVYVTRLLASGTTESYYHKNSVMSVFEFFSDHSAVSRSDPVVFVHQRINSDTCSGMIFERKETPVPNTTVARAQEKLNTSDENTVPESQHPTSNTVQSGSDQSKAEQPTTIPPSASS